MVFFITTLLSTQTKLCWNRLCGSWENAYRNLALLIDTINKIRVYRTRSYPLFQAKFYFFGIQKLVKIYSPLSERFYLKLLISTISLHFFLLFFWYSWHTFGWWQWGHWSSRGKPSHWQCCQIHVGIWFRTHTRRTIFCTDTVNVAAGYHTALEWSC